MQGERDFFANKNVLLQKIFAQIFGYVQKMLYLCSAKSLKSKMSYTQMAQLDVLNLVKGIQTEVDYMDFRNMLARYFAEKAQKQIDALWDNGTINEQTIEQWGNERMRTPYRYTVQQTVRRNARAAIATMRRQSELNGNSEMTLEDINNEILQARQVRKTAAQ